MPQSETDRPSVTAFIYVGDALNTDAEDIVFGQASTWADAVQLLGCDGEHFWELNERRRLLIAPVRFPFRDHTLRSMMLDHCQPFATSHVAFLGPNQVVVSPDLIMPTLRNDRERVVMATRYWMWGEGRHRVDSYWAPTKVPFIYPVKRLVENMTFRPATPWPHLEISAGEWADSDIEIQDYTFHTPSEGRVVLERGLDLRPYPGVEVVSWP